MSNFENDIELRTDHYFKLTKSVVEKHGDVKVTYAVFMRRPVIYCPKLAIEWIKLVTSNTATIYIDLETSTKDQGTNYVWILIDQKEVENNSRSRTVHIQIDCNKGKNRLHHIVVYDDQMGKGDIVNQVTNPSEWRSVLPGSLAYSVKELICS